MDWASSCETARGHNAVTGRCHNPSRSVLIQRGILAEFQLLGRDGLQWHRTQERRIHGVEYRQLRSHGGEYVLRFEDDTNIQNGPDLYVWVLQDNAYGSRTPAECIDLDKLKGNVGGQNYELPAEYDPEVHGAVLIWCERFDVPFATAPLT